MKKKILIVIGVILLILIGLVGYNLFLDMKQEEALGNEMKEITDMIDYENMDIDKMNEKLSRTVTTGDYQVLEKSMKQYLSDVITETTKLADILEDDRITKILSADNYKNDGPDFVSTKEYIKTTKANLEDGKSKVLELMTDEKIMSYINDKNLDDYYIDLYKESSIFTEDEKNDKTLEDSIDSLLDLLDISDEIIDFLSNNKKKWVIRNGEIYFATQELIDEYNNLISKIK